MLTPDRAPMDSRARDTWRRALRGSRSRIGPWAPWAAALLLAGCAGTPVRQGGVAMQAPINAATGCYAPQPNLRAAYNRDYTVLGHRYAPLREAAGYEVDGTASWYGWESGKTTSMGTDFNPRAFTAASRVLPLPTCVEVTNLRNGRSALVLVNDRGPFVDSRIMDLSYGAAKALGVTATGTAPVRIVALAHDRVQDAPPIGIAAPAAAAAAATAPSVAAAQTRFPAAPPEVAPARAQSEATAPQDMQVTPLPALTGPAGGSSTPAPAASSPGGDALGAWLASGAASAPASEADPAPQAAPGGVAQAPLPPGPPQAYVQTGAFTIEANARLEAERLRQAGLGPVEVVPGYVRGRTWYKVQIGPLPAGGQDPRLVTRLAGLGLRNYTFVQQ